mmetsp:Transcript_20442/g.15064  ORF Transcript_20442/g.15064 Transcript_20442/m.15064 type:complete len:128 (-) Transcript_20442:521-904(-)
MCCNIVYKRGQDSLLRGIMLSHDNMSWYWKIFSQIESLQGQDPDYPIYVISYIPLSNVVSNMLDFSRLIVSEKEVVVTFAKMEGDRLQGLLETIKEVRPTEFMAYAYIYQTLKDGIDKKIKERSRIY